MDRFTLKPTLRIAFIAGVGQVRQNQVLVGEQFRKFVPAILVEIQDPVETPVDVAAAPPAVIIPDPPVAVEPEVVSEPKQPPVEEPAPEIAQEPVTPQEPKLAPTEKREKIERKKKEKRS